MDVYLLRHAKSAHDPLQWSCDDDRPLSAKGRRRQQRVASGMAALGLDYDQAWVSPLRRAQETLDIVQDRAPTSKPVQVVEALRVWADPEDIASALVAENEKRPQTRLLLVGHNPHLSDLIAFLVKPPHPELRTSDLAWLRWSDAGPNLHRFLPRQELMAFGEGKQDAG